MLLYIQTANVCVRACVRIALLPHKLIHMAERKRVGKKKPCAALRLAGLHRRAISAQLSATLQRPTAVVVTTTIRRPFDSLSKVIRSQWRNPLTAVGRNAAAQ